MRIGLNGQKILIDNPAGPEQYTINLYKALAQLNTQDSGEKENTYIIYVPKLPPQKLIDEITQRNKNIKFKVINSLLSWTQLSLTLDLYKEPVDVFFTPVHTFPYLMPLKTKLVSMVHGLEYLTNKEYSKFAPRYILQPLIMQQMLWRSSKVITPSKATYNSILKNFWCDKNKLEIVNEGVDSAFNTYGELETKSVLEKYGLKEKQYLLFVSTIQPRKNIPQMIQAFAQVIRAYPELSQTKLVISGKNGWNYQESLEAPEKYGVENNVKFIGWTPQSDLPLLMSCAKAYVNFSFDEGFGLTLLEAMATGISVACSDIPAYKELGLDLVEYANPNNIKEMSEAIKKVLTYTNTNTIEKAKNRAQEFSWEATAKNTLRIFENL